MMAEQQQAAGAQTTQTDGGQQSGTAQTQQTQAQQPKIFTQADLDEQIRIRLEDRKSKYADYDDLKKFKDESEAKNKSELEKLSDKAAKAQADVEKMKSETSERLIRAEAKAEAAKQGFSKPDKAIRLADLSKVTVDEDGNVTGLEDALKKLAEEMPELLSKKGAPQTQVANPTKGSAADGKETDEQRRARLRGGSSFSDWTQQSSVNLWANQGPGGRSQEK